MLQFLSPEPKLKAWAFIGARRGGAARLAARRGPRDRKIVRRASESSVKEALERRIVYLIIAIICKCDTYRAAIERTRRALRRHCLQILGPSERSGEIGTMVAGPLFSSLLRSMRFSSCARIHPLRILCVSIIATRERHRLADARCTSGVT